MKQILFALVLTLCTASAFAWTCPTGERWVQVPSNTQGARKVEGLYFQCQPTVDPKGGAITNNSSSQSSSQASSSASASSNQSQQQSANATASNNGNSSNNTSITYKQVHQTPFAYSPEALPTSPCIKGYSGGAATPLLGGSFGGGKIDKGCESRETARSFALLGNPSAAAKLLCSTDAAKRAKLTQEDCLALQMPQPVAVPQAPAPITVAPAPVSVVVVPPAPAPVSPSVALVVAARKKARKPLRPCPALPQEK